MDNIKQLSRLIIFAEVVQQGSFTGAAKQLGITKSAVSQQIKSLEADMDIRVLNRTTRGVSTTALGQKLLSRCQVLKDQVDLIFKDIVNAEENPRGRFAITLPHSLESNVVMPAIEQLCIEYPGIEPEIIVSDSSLDLVENNLDVAIHAGDLPDSSYRALPIGTITEIFCATPLYLNKNFTPQKLSDLAQLKWISTSWQKQKMSVYNSTNKEKVTIELTQFSKVNTFSTALAMALRHLGLVLLPDNVAKPLIKSGELVHIMEQFTGPVWPVHTLHAYQREKPVHLTRFHQLLCNHFHNL
ncbi:MULTISPECIES: LysR family transcriptional regulator [Colwellia]|uniref:Transcriptional regulator, LysR family n=1 Tax=Colwellia psychrerythraea (strain 34H / ATCC BAA-681) TaxID=167879 RepID=Q484V5_COLP3|nr:MULTISPECIES: LysR family transcriptional regulator [Colwellia]AAZ24583.1 transcriptional regulator, LysR family [Colwellia psychrerythraea 34H]PKH89055.1 LysR family transcriptional regulator [Colwellia sp. Bg11-28]